MPFPVSLSRKDTGEISLLTALKDVEIRCTGNKEVKFVLISDIFRQK